VLGVLGVRVGSGRERYRIVYRSKLHEHDTALEGIDGLAAA
jgi:hypothetical protein